MSKIELMAGDNRDHLRRLIEEGVQVHSVVTDPPYGLVSIKKRFGKKGSAAAKSEGNDGSFSRLSGGFMGKVWDGTEIERDPEFWKLVHDVLLPGGCVFAFGGSRTVHWQMVAMEQAGFVIHPMHIWAFGSGFPKAHNAARAIEGVLRGGKARYSGRDQHLEIEKGGDTPGKQWRDAGDRTMKSGAAAWTNQRVKVTTPEAQQWEGWAYGTQTQKPALEPIVLAQKPFSEKTGAANLLKHGVGAFNVDATRVGDSGSRNNGRKVDSDIYGKFGPTDRVDYNRGRHPANLIHDGSPEVVAMFPDSKGQLAKASERTEVRKTQNCYGAMSHGSGGQEPGGDDGSAARFFNCFPQDADPIFYNPKANKKDRAGSKHPTVKPVALLQHLIRHITPPGGTVLDPFAGSGTTAEAARREGFDCILMEQEGEYLDFLRERFPDCVERPS